MAQQDLEAFWWCLDPQSPPMSFRPVVLNDGLAPITAHGSLRIKLWYTTTYTRDLYCEEQTPPPLIDIQNLNPGEILSLPGLMSQTVRSDDVNYVILEYQLFLDGDENQHNDYLRVPLDC